MEAIRYGNDINVTWSVFGRNGSKYSLSDKVRRLWLVNGPRKKEITSYSVQGRNQLVFVIDDTEINRLGTYKLVLQIREPDSVIEDSAYDLTQVFMVVSETYPFHTNKAVNGQCDISFRSILKNTYISELEGESAYEIAVRHGFDGTEAEWLASLIGVRSVEQTETSGESGGENIISFTLADGSVREVSVRNGAAGERGSDTLSGLSDTAISSLSAGQYLKWNGSRWVNAPGADYSYGAGIRIASNVISADIQGIANGLIAAGYSLSGEGGGQAGVTTLRALTDVSLASPVDGQVLAYDASISRWVAKTVQSGGGGQSGGGDIDPSVLADYVTIAGAETITGSKTFTAQAVLTDTLIIGSGATTLAPEAPGAKKRIYFGDTEHYLELNTSGFFFYGGGVYTNGFMSAGGLSGGGEGGGGGATDLNGLSDVTIDSSALSDKQVLKYAGGGWVNAQLALGDLSNVDFETDIPQEGQVLTYDSANQVWKPVFVSGSSGATVFYGTCSTDRTTLDKIVNCPNFTSADLKSGTILVVYMTNWVDAKYTTNSVTINVNSTGAKRIITGYNYVTWGAAEVVLFIYNGTNWYLSPTYLYMQNHISGGSGGDSGTSYYAGTGLSLSGSTFNLEKATTSALGGVMAATSSTSSISTTTATTGTYYSVGVDKNGKMYVRVPSGGTSVSWGTEQNNTVKLTVGGVEKTVCLDGYSSGSSPSGNYLSLSGGTMTGTINSLAITPTTAGTLTISSTGAMTALGNGYDLGAESLPYRAIHGKALCLAPGIYVYYDTVNNCIRTNAPIASDSWISAGGVA